MEPSLTAAPATVESPRATLLTREDRLALLRFMLLMRAAEEKALSLYKQGKIPGSFYDGCGQEAISVGAAFALSPADRACILHRDLGAHFVRGVAPERYLANYMGRAGGVTGGKDGNMHFGDPALGCVGMVSMLPDMAQVTTGLALAIKMRSAGAVAMTFFGEGSTANGQWHEAMNFAGIHRLPAVFILENNQFAYSTPNRLEFFSDPIARAREYGLGGEAVDGNDVEAVFAAAHTAVECARSGGGPSLIECVTMRMHGHGAHDDMSYVPEGMLDEWRRRDPIETYATRLVRDHGIEDEEITVLREAVARELAEAAEKALASPMPGPERAFEGVFATQWQPLGAGEAPWSGWAGAEPRSAPSGAGADPEPGTPASSPGRDDPTSVEEMTYLEAISDALRYEMGRDERVFCLGEDVGEFGGAFKVTEGFAAEFGADRCLDTPLAESSIIGASIGAAIEGLRPVCEMQFADFVACGFDQLVNVAAKLHYRQGVAVPMVIRLPSGGGFSGGPFHSQNPEAWFLQAPGLKVVAPASAADAKGLLISAIRDPNPVCFLEHKGLYRHVRGEVPAGEHTVPIGEARVVREGEDLTVIAYGSAVLLAEQAAGELGESIEILDLRTLWPLDREAILAAARKTGKVLVIHEATGTCGVGAEVAALIGAEAFEDLDAPLRRLSAADVPIPFSPPLEQAVLPQLDDVKEACRELLAY